MQNEVLRGSWSRLNEYAVIANIDILGAPESVIVKSLEYLQADGVTVADVVAGHMPASWNFRFDYAGELSDYSADINGGTFFSDASGVDPENIPCAAGI